MSKKNANPYTNENGTYAKLMAHVTGKCKGIITKTALIAYAISVLKKTDTASASAVGVVLSPREEGTTKGDCRGNFSAMGHKYFFQPLKKKEGEEQAFRFRRRAKELEPHKRPVAAVEVKATKKATAAKAKAKVATKAKAKKKTAAKKAAEAKA